MAENGPDDTSLQDEFDGEVESEQTESGTANADESGIEDPVTIVIPDYVSKVYMP